MTFLRTGRIDVEACAMARGRFGIVDALLSGLLLCSLYILATKNNEMFCRVQAPTPYKLLKFSVPTCLRVYVQLINSALSKINTGFDKQHVILTLCCQH